MILAKRPRRYASIRSRVSAITPAKQNSGLQLETLFFVDVRKRGEGGREKGEEGEERERGKEKEEGKRGEGEGRGRMERRGERTRENEREVDANEL